MGHQPPSPNQRAQKLGKAKTRVAQSKWENSKRKISSHSLKIPRKAQKLLMRMKNIDMVVTRFQVPREEPKPLFKNFTQRSQIFITKFGLNQILVNLSQFYDQTELFAFRNCKGIDAVRRKTMLINQLPLQ